MATVASSGGEPDAGTAIAGGRGGGATPECACGGCISGGISRRSANRSAFSAKMAAISAMRWLRDVSSCERSSTRSERSMKPGDMLRAAVRDVERGGGVSSVGFVSRSDEMAAGATTLGASRRLAAARVAAAIGSSLRSQVRSSSASASERPSFRLVAGEAAGRATMGRGIACSMRARILRCWARGILPRRWCRSMSSRSTPADCGLRRQIEKTSFR